MIAKHPEGTLDKALLQLEPSGINQAEHGIGSKEDWPRRWDDDINVYLLPTNGFLGTRRLEMTLHGQRPLCSDPMRNQDGPRPEHGTSTGSPATLTK